MVISDLFNYFNHHDLIAIKIYREILIKKLLQCARQFNDFL